MKKGDILLYIPTGEDCTYLERVGDILIEVKSLVSGEKMIRDKELFELAKEGEESIKNRNEKAYEYINALLSKGMKVREIAEQSEVSYAYINQLKKKQINCSQDKFYFIKRTWNKKLKSL